MTTKPEVELEQLKKEIQKIVDFWDEKYYNSDYEFDGQDWGSRAVAQHLGGILKEFK